MDTCKPYRPVENQIQEIQQEQQQFDMSQGNTGPLPMYTNYAQPMPSAPGTTVQIVPIAHQTTSQQPIIAPPVGPKSMEMTCPSCRCRITTTVRHRTTSKTHIACLLLSWTICCCCLPYCMDTCRNANHFCPMCGAFIGTYSS